MKFAWSFLGMYTLLLIGWAATGRREVTAGYLDVWVIGLIVAVVASVMEKADGSGGGE